MFPSALRPVGIVPQTAGVIGRGFDGLGGHIGEEFFFEVDFPGFAAVRRRRPGRVHPPGWSPVRWPLVPVLVRGRHPLRPGLWP